MTVGLHHGMHDLQIVQEIGLRHAQKIWHSKQGK